MRRSSANVPRVGAKSGATLRRTASDQPLSHNSRRGSAAASRRGGRGGESLSSDLITTGRIAGTADDARSRINTIRRQIVEDLLHHLEKAKDHDERKSIRRSRRKYWEDETANSLPLGLSFEALWKEALDEGRQRVESQKPNPVDNSLRNVDLTPYLNGLDPRQREIVKNTIVELSGEIQRLHDITDEHALADVLASKRSSFVKKFGHLPSDILTLLFGRVKSAVEGIHKVKLPRRHKRKRKKEQDDDNASFHDEIYDSITADDKKVKSSKGNAKDDSDEHSNAMAGSSLAPRNGTSSSHETLLVANQDISRSNEKLSALAGNVGAEKKIESDGSSKTHRPERSAPVEKLSEENVTTSDDDREVECPSIPTKHLLYHSQDGQQARQPTAQDEAHACLDAVRDIMAIVGKNRYLPLQSILDKQRLQWRKKFLGWSDCKFADFWKQVVAQAQTDWQRSNDLDPVDWSFLVLDDDRSKQKTKEYLSDVDLYASD